MAVNLLPSLDSFKMNISTGERDWLGLFTHESVMSALVRELLSTSSDQLPTSPAIKRFSCLVISDSDTPLEIHELKKLSESIRDTYSNNSCYRGGSVDSVQTGLNSLSLINQELSIPLNFLPNSVGAVDGEIAGVKCLKSECFDCQITSRFALDNALDFINNLEKLRSNTSDELQLHNELRSYGFIKLVESLKDTSITFLNLSGNRIDCDLLIDLVQHLHSTQIESLDLSRNEIGHKGFEYLNKALKETQISSLNVSKNCPSEVRCRKHCSEIENSVEKEDEVILCNSQCYVTDILENSATTFLDLSYSDVIDPEYVTSILRNSKIEHLDFTSSELSVESFGLFVPYLVDSSVTTLNLAGCKQLGNDGLKILASLLKNTNIHTLDVSCNKINGDGLKVFAPSLVDSKITSLNISNNLLDSDSDSDGISSLALVLPKTKIFSLELNFCFLSNRSCEILSACLLHTKITSLGFANNVPNDNDVESLAAVLKNSQISSIDVGGIQSAGETIVQLLSLCVVGSQLTNINLCFCEIDCSLMKDLVNAVKNSNITSIHLIGTSMNRDCKVMEIFVSCLVESKIRYLHLEDGCYKMRIGAVKCLALALKNTEISSLDLSRNMLDSESLKVLAPCLVGTKLTHLKLEENEVDRAPNLTERGWFGNWDGKNDIGVKYLAQALKSSEITNLNLAGNRLSCKSLHNLILSLPYTKIETLNLSGNSVCCNKFYLANILMNTKISSLELGSQQDSHWMYQGSFNTDTSINLQSIMRCVFPLYYFSHINILHTQNITSLNLSRNQISCCGELKELCKSLSGSQVASLDLSGNRINCDGIYYLAQVLQHSKIISLNLGKNEISSNGVKYLAMNFPGSQIEIVDLSYNLITDESIEYLSENLVNTKISHLNLRGNQVGCQAVYHLWESVAEINVQLDSNLFRYPGCIIEIKQISLKKGIDHLIDYVSDKTEVTKVYIRSRSRSVRNGSNWFDLADLASIAHFSKINITEIEMVMGSCFPYSIFKNITHLKLNETIAYEPGENGEIIIELRLQNIEQIRKEYLKEFSFNNIMYLDLSNNNLKDDKFKYLAQVFNYGSMQRNNCLISLNLSNNQLGVESAEILAKVLPFTRALTYIDLNGNNIGYSGFKSLMNVVDKTNLCWLSLGENNIEDQLQEDMELSPYIVPRNADEIPVAFQVRYLFMQLVSLNTSSGELEFTVPTIDSNPPVNITHYPKLITIYNLFKNWVKYFNMHVYDYYYMKSKKHDKQLMEKIDIFVKELEKRFLSFIDSNLTILEQAFGYKSFVLLVKECERSGLTKCVESLLLHRVLYYVDDDGEILHPFIYRMMLKYSIPLYCEQMEPNKREQIISYFRNHSEFEEAQTIVHLLAHISN